MDTPLMQLSQGHLTLLNLCPRKYQYTYLEQLFIPSLSTQTEQQEALGRHFHLLMQQYWMGLDITPVLQASTQLQSCFETFQANPPHLIEGDRLTEHRRMLKLGNYLLVGIFDLLAINQTQGQIIDWKTYHKPRSPEPLRQNWQTQLYLYLLAETSSLSPDQLSMTYWFSHISPEQDTHTYTYHYSKAQHQQAHQTITQLLAQYDQWQTEPDQLLPQVDPSQGHCIGEQHRCPYVSRCGRSPEQVQLSALLEIESIPEIPLSRLNASVEAG